MVRAEQFELRDGSEVLAILRADPDGRKTLEHALTEDKVSRCRGVGVYDSADQMLSIKRADHCVYLTQPDGRRQLKLQVGSNDEFSDVKDPKRQVKLVIKLSGSGSVRNEPIKDGDHMFNLCWIGQAY